jgi:hypothetical protein
MEFQDDRVRLRQSSISSLDSASGALITIGEYREKDGWTSSGFASHRIWTQSAFSRLYVPVNRCANPTPRTNRPTLGSLGHLTEIINYGMRSKVKATREALLKLGQDRGFRQTVDRPIDADDLAVRVESIQRVD